MRFMILLKATADTEAGKLPSQDLLEQMGAFNEELVKAGVMRDGEGLKPSAVGARVAFSGKDRSVAMGPFENVGGQLITGFWLWECASLEAAIDWVKRVPNPTGEMGEIEIRQLYSAEDFGDAMTPEMREKEEALRSEIAAQA
jgi:hypothetical protein